MMTIKLWTGLVICGALLLSVGAAPSSAADCKAKLVGSWQCELENVDNHESMDFELSFNQSHARMYIKAIDLEASGPFACEMHRRFFRGLVVDNTFLATLVSFFEGIPRSLALTGDSHWHRILNGNGLIANISILSTSVPTSISTNALANTSAFVYSCDRLL